MLYIKQKCSFFVFVLFLGFASMCILSYSRIRAENTIGLQLTPLVTELDLENGETAKFSISLVNLNQTPVIYSIGFKAFTRDVFNNDIIFNTSSYSKDAQNWIKTDQNTILLDSKQKTEVAFEVNVPYEAISGSYSLLVNFTAVDTSTVIENYAKIEPNVASVLLLTVNGSDLLDLAEITEFKPARKIFFTKDISLDAVITNFGQTYIKPVGVFEVAGAPDASLIYQSDFNPKTAIILRESKKTFDIEFIPTKYKFGKYKATLTVAYGRRNSVIIKETSFWIVPWDLILKILIVIGLFIAFVSAILIRRKRNHKYL